MVNAPPGRAGIIGHRIDDIHRPFVSGSVRAATRRESNPGRDDTVDDRDRLIAGSDLEHVAERQHRVPGSASAMARRSK